LECPASSEPKAATEFGIYLVMIIVFHGRDITQVCVADLGLLVPPEHGVDSFGELSTATLVDAAGIDPLIFISGQHMICLF
jgi:hypothetical protein